MHIFIDTVDGAHWHRGQWRPAAYSRSTLVVEAAARGGARTKTGASQMDEAEPDL
jgi:hypothetical protein